jgi:hypothetical protein
LRLLRAEPETVAGAIIASRNTRRQREAILIATSPLSCDRRRRILIDAHGRGVCREFREHACGQSVSV